MVVRCDTLANSLGDPNVGLIVKHKNKLKKIETRSFTSDTFGVKRCVGVLGWVYGELTSDI